jgi:CTP synthase
VAPGFGERGIEGKISAIKYARENNIPFFGLCLGMQCAVIEWARNVLHYGHAHTTEIDPKSPYPVIDLMEDQKEKTLKGGTMRLGAYPCQLAKNSLANKIYNHSMIMERHRHRFEFNNQYKSAFEKSGMKTTGINPVSKLVEIVEIDNHPFFIGVQYHPELKSTVEHPAPLFVHFIAAAKELASKR